MRQAVMQSACHGMAKGWCQIVPVHKLAPPRPHSVHALAILKEWASYPHLTT